MHKILKINHLWLFIGLLVTIACTREEPKPSQAINLDVNIETAKDVEIIYSDSAKVRVKIAGPTLLYHVNTREPQQEFIDGVKVDFYGPDGQVTSTLTGKYGIRHEAEGKVFVRDSVVWQSMEGDRLETEELIWDERQQRVYNHRFVVLRRFNEVIMGHGFEATQDFKHAKVIAVEGTKSIDEISDDFQ